MNRLVSNCKKVELALKKSEITFTKLPFPDNCYLLDSKHTESDLWKTSIYKRGEIYVQSVSSQIPTAFFQAEEPMRILDATAAPWGKTSQLSEKYPDAEIYAFESSKVRYEKMCHNLKKLGCHNITPIYDSIENIAEHIEEKNSFDIVLIDAPCSNEWSLLYNSARFLENWGVPHIKKNYKRQKSIIDAVVPYLKVDWELIYSTCTLAPEENEAVAHYVLCNHPEFEIQDIEVPETTGINVKQWLPGFGKHIYKKDIQKSIRTIPSDIAEWFFIAKFIKKEEI